MTRFVLFTLACVAPLFAQDGGCGTVGPISSPLVSGGLSEAPSPPQQSCEGSPPTGGRRPTGASMPSTEPAAPPALDQKLPATIETATFGLG